MTATIPFIEEKAAQFNSLCFAGILPPIPVKLVKARTFVGKATFRGRTDFVLRVSTLFDLSEEEWEDVVIHELIHFYVAFQEIRDSSAHGREFRRIMATINETFSRHVTVRHKGAPPKTEIRENNVCVSLLGDDRWGVTICSDAMKPRLDRQLPRYYRLQKMTWYRSADPFFNRYPRSRTPKIYKISLRDLEEHLGGEP